MSYYLYSIIGGCKQVDLICKSGTTHNLKMPSDQLGYRIIHNKHYPNPEPTELSQNTLYFVLASITLLVCAIIAINSLSIKGDLLTTSAYETNIALVGIGGLLAIGIANHLQKWRWKVLFASLVIGGGYIALNICGHQAMLESPLVEWIHLGPAITITFLALLTLQIFDGILRGRIGPKLSL